MTQSTPAVDGFLRLAARQWLSENGDQFLKLDEGPWSSYNPFLWRAQEVFVEQFRTVFPEDIDLNQVFSQTAHLMGAGWTADEVIRLAPELIALQARLQSIHDERAEERLADRWREAAPRPDPPPVDAVGLWAAIKDQPVMGLLDDAPPVGGGVYALYSDDESLLYVGKAMKFADRLKSHANDYLKRQAGFSYWSVWVIEGERERQAVEAHLIRTEAPLLNVAGR